MLSGYFEYIRESLKPLSEKELRDILGASYWTLKRWKEDGVPAICDHRDNLINMAYSIQTYGAIAVMEQKKIIAEGVPEHCKVIDQGGCDRPRIWNKPYCYYHKEMSKTKFFILTTGDIIGVPPETEMRFNKMAYCINMCADDIQCDVLVTLPDRLCKMHYSFLVKNGGAIIKINGMRKKVLYVSDPAGVVLDGKKISTKHGSQVGLRIKEDSPSYSHSKVAEGANQCG